MSQPSTREDEVRLVEPSSALSARQDSDRSMTRWRRRNRRRGRPRVLRLEDALLPQGGGRQDGRQGQLEG